MGFRWAAPNSFPTQSLPDLEGVVRPLELLWQDGPALIVVGHRDCATTRLALPFVDRIHRRRPEKTTVTLVLQDEPQAAGELVSDLGLEVPVLLEPDPYPLAAELQLRSAPTLMVVGSDGTISRAYEGFSRDDMSALATFLGLEGPLFSPEDTAPPRRPG